MAGDNPNIPVSTASVSWIDGQQNLNLHVFSCDGYTVTERQYGSGGWTDGTLSQAASAISATAWVDSNGAHVRVYCTSDDATVEWCLDPGSSDWYQGTYTTF